ncbi:Uncharacterised protein [Mycobacteroides abscessus subsp. abscessus]|nr:Uncharacterised protein [Mycobacteroides abscessus subsp. abscessus]
MSLVSGRSSRLITVVSVALGEAVPATFTTGRLSSELSLSELFASELSVAVAAESASSASVPPARGSMSSRSSSVLGSGS